MAGLDSRPPVLEPPEHTELRPIAATMKGRVQKENGVWTVKGKWSFSWEAPVKSDFVYRASGCTPDQERPYCGRYEGHFIMKEAGKPGKRYEYKSLTLSFTANAAGGYNVEGRSVTDFGACNIAGVLGSNGRIRFVKAQDPMAPAPTLPKVSGSTGAQTPSKGARFGGGKKRSKEADAMPKCGSIMKHMQKNTDQAFWFLERVEDVAREKPDYATRITHPMDFHKILRKLKARQYLKVADFASDVRLTFDNAKSYYSSSMHPCHVAAVALGNVFEKKYALLEAQLRKGGATTPASPVRSPGRSPKSPKVQRPSPMRAPVESKQHPPAARVRAKSTEPAKRPALAQTAMGAKPGTRLAKTSGTTAKTSSSGQWQLQAMQLIRYCRGMPGASWFNHPVPPDLDGYAAVVTHPMDFSTLQANLKARRYHSLDAFLGDARLIFSNAMAYNRVGDPCYVAAETIEAIMEEKVRDITGRDEIPAPAAAVTTASTCIDTAPGSRPPEGETGLSLAEKEKLEEDVSRLSDEDAERVLEMLTESGTDFDEDGEVDMDRLSVKVQREVQAFVRRCLHPDEAATDGSTKTNAPTLVDQAKPDRVPAAEAASGASPTPGKGPGDAILGRAGRGKSVDAPPVAVADNVPQPDTAGTDQEASPHASPRDTSKHQEPSSDRSVNSVLQRVASTLDGDVTSSSDDDSDDEAVLAPTKRKREIVAPPNGVEKPAPASKKAKTKMEAGTAEPALEKSVAPAAHAMDIAADDADARAAAPASLAPVTANAEGEADGLPMDLETPTLARAPSLNAWKSSAAAFEETEAPASGRKRVDSADQSADQDSLLWAESQRKSEELKQAERVRHAEEKDRQARVAAQRAAEEQARLQAAQEARERKERARLEELEAEEAARAKRMEAEKMAHLTGAPLGHAAGAVDLDEAENLLEEFQGHE